MEFLSFLVGIGLIVLIFVSVYKICKKLGYGSGSSVLLSVLLFIPIISVVVLVYLGFSDRKGGGA